MDVQEEPDEEQTHGYGWVIGAAALVLLIVLAVLFNWRLG